MKCQGIMFSIIVPTYRQTEKLNDCLASVLKQNMQCWEVILVDDNAENPKFRNYVQNLIDRIQDERIKYFRNIENMNASYSRNFGIEQSAFENIIFLDDDDELLNDDYLDVFSKYVTKANDDRILYHCESALYNNGRPYRTIRPNCVGSGLQVALLTGKTSLMIGSFVMKKSFIKKFGGFDERLNRFQDIQLMLNFFDYGGIVEPVHGAKVRINYDRDQLRLNHEEYKAAKSIFLLELVQKNVKLSDREKKYILDFHEFDLYVHRLRTGGLKYLASFKLPMIKNVFNPIIVKKFYFVIKRKILKFVYHK